MQPSKPQPFRLPQRFDSPTLAKYAIPGEPTVIVRAVGVGSTAPFEYSDRNGRQAIFRYEREYDAHVLKVPASVWNHNKGFMAHELMDQRRLPHPLVVTVNIPTVEATSPIKGLIDAMKADPEYAWGWHCNLAMAMHDSGAGPHQACNRGAALFLSQLSYGAVDTTQHPAYENTQGDIQTATISSQGELDSSEAHNLVPAASIPAPDTTSPEMDAPGNSEEASDVVVGQVSERPGASATETLSSPDAPASTGQNSGVIMHKDKPMYSAAWDKLESPMRLKELAAVLETEPETLKASIQEPLSAVELGHAGWVKRREPQA